MLGQYGSVINALFNINAVINMYLHWIQLSYFIIQQAKTKERVWDDAEVIQ